MDIHKSGGGIHYTVDCVRKASEDELYEAFKREAQMFIQAGMVSLLLSYLKEVKGETGIEKYQILNVSM